MGRFPATARRGYYAVIAPGRLQTEQSSVGKYYGVMASAMPALRAARLARLRSGFRLQQHFDRLHSVSASPCLGPVSISDDLARPSQLSSTGWWGECPTRSSCTHNSEGEMLAVRRRGVVRRRTVGFSPGSVSDAGKSWPVTCRCARSDSRRTSWFSGASGRELRERAMDAAADLDVDLRRSTSDG